MEARLIAWGQAVKRRGRRRGLPVLWLMTDTARLRDPVGWVLSLPRSAPPFFYGVVLRHAMAAAAALRLARVCRARRVVLVAADARLAARVGAGVHLRRGRRGLVWARRRVVTASAHDVAEVRRSLLAGADAVFISPLLATASHPGVPGVGVMRWRTLARRAGRRAIALGGVDAGHVRALPKWCGGAAGVAGFM